MPYRIVRGDYPVDCQICGEKERTLIKGILSLIHEKESSIEGRTRQADIRDAYVKRTLEILIKPEEGKPKKTDAVRPYEASR